MEWVRGWMEAWRWMEAWWEARRWREWVRGAGVDGGVEVEGGVVGGVDVGAVRSERSKRPGSAAAQAPGESPPPSLAGAVFLHAVPFTGGLN